jgi:hypothetical protein
MCEAPLKNIVVYSTTDGNTHNGIVSDLTNPSTGPLTDPTTATTAEWTTANSPPEIKEFKLFVLPMVVLFTPT